jgi:uncharacterized tellurite resistance protein B-like protein
MISADPKRPTRVGRPPEVHVFERFEAAYRRVLGGRTEHDAVFSSDAEHVAVLELLVATMFANGVVTDAEFREIEQLATEHDWSSPSLPFEQALGSATAAVRNALDEPAGLSSLLAPIAERITTPGLRAEVVDACAMVAHSDGGTDTAESAWLDEVRSTFAG